MPEPASQWFEWHPRRFPPCRDPKAKSPGLHARAIMRADRAQGARGGLPRGLFWAPGQSLQPLAHLSPRTCDRLRGNSPTLHALGAQAMQQVPPLAARCSYRPAAPQVAPGSDPEPCQPATAPPQALLGGQPSLGLPGSPSCCPADSDHFDCLGDELEEQAKLLEDEW